MLESEYQAKLIKRLRAEFLGCMILKNDSGYQQGIPDLLLLHETHWALLEVKASADSARQPNQEYWVNLASNLSFGAFIFPENEDEVINAIRETFKPGRPSRLSVAQ